MTPLIVGAVQIACRDDVQANLDKLEMHIREADSLSSRRGEASVSERRVRVLSLVAALAATPFTLSAAKRL